MKKHLPALLCVLALAFTLIGCGGGGGGTAKSRYAGFDPKGDYLEYAIDMANGTIEFINHTTGDAYGPYYFTRITDINRTKGFGILYETEIIPPGDIGDMPDRYLVFALMDKVALFAQMQDSKGTSEWTDDTNVGNPVYALSPRYRNINYYNGQAFNFVKFKIVDLPNTETYSNSEGGFFAFDTNEATADTPAGRVFGAAFSNQTYLKERPQYPAIPYPGLYSLYRPPEYVWGTSSFSYDENTKAYTSAINEYQISLIGTESGDIVIDFGPGQGGAFAIRQATTEEFQPQYRGTYLLLAYCEKSQTGSPEQTIRVYRAVLGDNGNIAIDNPWEPGDGGSVDLTPFKTFNPGLFMPVNAFKDLTKCDEEAISEAVQNAYNCHGAFCYQEVGGGSGAMIVIDPDGNYLCFTLFEDKGGGNAYEYSFGFGIKDPGYPGP